MAFVRFLCIRGKFLKTKMSSKIICHGPVWQLITVRSCIFSFDVSILDKSKKSWLGKKRNLLYTQGYGNAESQGLTCLLVCHLDTSLCMRRSFFSRWSSMRSRSRFSSMLLHFTLPKLISIHLEERRRRRRSYLKILGSAHPILWVTKKNGATHLNGIHWGKKTRPILGLFCLFGKTELDKNEREKEVPIFPDFNFAQNFKEVPWFVLSCPKFKLKRLHKRNESHLIWWANGSTNRVISQNFQSFEEQKWTSYFRKAKYLHKRCF